MGLTVDTLLCTLVYAILHVSFSLMHSLHVQIQFLVFEEVLSNSESGIPQSLLQGLSVAGHVDICTECR